MEFERTDFLDLSDQSWIISTVTGPAKAQVGVPAPPLVLGYVSLWHSVRAIARDALAYSNIRRIWWPLAYLDLPLLFVLFSGVTAGQPGNFVSLGRASAQFNRSGLPGAAKAPRTARLLWLVFVASFAVTFGVPTLIRIIGGPSQATADAILIWLLVIIGVPGLGYVLPALVQQRRGRGVDDWKTVTLKETSRTPVLVSMLGVWPCKGGGKKGSGDGFKLMKALAATARTNNQIMVGVARTKNLAKKYVAVTGAEQSQDNLRHLRWP